MLNTIVCINNLIEKSQGNLISMGSGIEYGFSRIKTYSNAEIGKFESSRNIKLPNDYRQFLMQVGACNLYTDEYELGYKFHTLEDIEEFTKEVFDGRENPFPKLLLTVSLEGRGDIGGFILSETKENFTVFFNEDDPEEWIRTKKLATFANWLNKLVETEAEKDLV